MSQSSVRGVSGSAAIAAPALVPKKVVAAPDGPAAHQMQQAREDSLPQRQALERVGGKGKGGADTVARMRAALEKFVADPANDIRKHLASRLLHPFIAEGPQDTRYFYLDAVLMLAAAGLGSWKGKRILDIGANDCGFVAAVKAAGAKRAVGVDVAVHADLPLAEQTSPPYEHVLGSFPTEVGNQVGGAFDLIVARNTFKRGFVDPVDGGPRFVELGLPRQEYLADLARRLVPGGLFMIYNAAPADPALAHQACADGVCPFSREELEKAGFEVVVHRLDATFFGKICIALLGVELGEISSEVTLVRRRA